MNEVFDLIDFFIVSSSISAQPFPSVTLSAQDQMNQILQNLELTLTSYLDKIIVVDDSRLRQGQITVRDPKKKINDCHIIHIRSQSKTTANRIEEELSFECDNHQFKKIQQIRVGSNLQPYQLKDWFQWRVSNLFDLEAYKIEVSWQLFQLQFTQPKYNSLSLHLLTDSQSIGVNDISPIYEYEFKEISNDKIAERKSVVNRKGNRYQLLFKKTRGTRAVL